ncbi:MAG: hypothetical protein MUP21_04380 [Dehalococcoidia bacterium]|nr:hypothetical protein [Dehalococcoidia bacterium]
MKVLDCAEQGLQPTTNTEDELVRFDVDYLMSYLGSIRGTSYSVVGQPDLQERESPQPDYLIEDRKNGNLIAIEHARLFESQESEKRFVFWAQALIAAEQIPMRWIRFPNPQQLGKRLSEFFDEKLSKGQLDKFGQCERILLARNMWSGAVIRLLLSAEPYFKPQKRTACDHFYLIVEGRLLEMF